MSSVVRLWEPRNPYDLQAVETAEPRKADSTCTRCSASEGASVVCAKAEAFAATRKSRNLLVVSQSPTQWDLKTGLHLTGASGFWLRKQLEKLWPGGVVFDYAVRCPVGKGSPNRLWVSQCRGYLARTIQVFNPERILCIGPIAADAVLGRRIDAHSARTPWAYLGTNGAYCYTIPPFREWWKNLHMRRLVDASLERALVAPVPPPPPTDAILRRWEPGLDDEFFEWLEAADPLFYDCETGGRFADDDFRISALAMAHADSKVVWGWANDDLAPGSLGAETVSEALLSGVATVAHNRKFDDAAVRRHFSIPDPVGVHFCSMLDRRLIYGDARVALDIAQEAVGLGGAKDEVKQYTQAAAKRIRKEAADIAKESPDPEAALKRSHAYTEPLAYAYAEIPEEVALKYVGKDAFTGAIIHKQNRELLKQRPFLERTSGELVMPLSDALGRVQEKGIRVRRNHARKLQKYFGKRIYALRNELAKFADINWNSSKQLSAYLFDDLGIKPTSFTKSKAPSTDKAALQRIRSEYDLEVIDKLLAYRGVSKLATTYAWGLERFICDDGRIHTQYKIHGAETGRLSSASPNLQNIPSGGSDDPVHADDGKRIKSLFLASSADHILISADYSQLEIRVAAMLSRDPVMRSLLDSGEDFHLATAKKICHIFKVPLKDVTKDHWLRRVAKQVNFALIYGKGDKSLAADLGITVAMAASVRKAILGAFARMALWSMHQEEFVRKNGYVVIPRFGTVPSRVRPLTDATSPRSDLSGSALRSAVNTPIQGCGSEYCMAALVGMDMVLNNIPLNSWQKTSDGAWDHVDRARRQYHKILKGRAHIVVSVHDSIMGDVQRVVQDEYRAMCQDVMEGFPSPGIVTPADFTRGPTWGEMEDWV